MKNYFSRTVAAMAGALAMICALSSVAQAQTSAATPTKYIVNIESISICTDPNCTIEEKLSTNTGPVPFNLANILSTQGTEPFGIDRYVNATGNYQYVKLIIANSIQVEGTIPITVPITATCNTVTGGVTYDNGASANLQNMTVGDPLGTMVYEVYNPIATTLPVGLTITFPSSTQLQFIYKLGGGILVNAGELLPNFDLIFKVQNTLVAYLVSPTDCRIYIEPPTIFASPEK
ncbi:MAG: hypothetical protein JKY99_09045 [Rhizobiales bacterium]|nr:hypothetical protein [Hyphomicrobiales bacterium]